MRDELLGSALRDLDVPEHRPGFQRELRRRLRPARRIRYAVLPVAAIVAAVASVTLHRGGSPAEAAVVQAKMRAALASFRNVSGTIVAPGTHGKPVRTRFVLDANGDYRTEGPRWRDVEVFDAGGLTTRSIQHSASLGGSALFFTVRTGVPLGPPDEVPPLATFQLEFGGYVQAALTAGDPQVEDVTYDGRPAWRLLIASQGTRVTIDRATGMAVEVEDVRFHRTLRIVGLVVDRRLPAGTFSLRFPRGVQVTRFDSGYRRAALPAALAPTWLPAGYRPLRAARLGDVWALLYQRGFEQIVVTVRPGAVPLSDFDGVMPHAEARHGRLTVTAFGAASPAYLERVARSAR
jgi:hypothetical protein